MNDYNRRFNDDSILARFYGKSSVFTDIPNPLFKEYNVKKGLRNEDGTGVRIGLTKVSDVIGYTKDKDGNVIVCMTNFTPETYDDYRMPKDVHVYHRMQCLPEFAESIS